MGEIKLYEVVGKLSSIQTNLYAMMSINPDDKLIRDTYEMVVEAQKELENKIKETGKINNSIQELLSMIR